MSPCAQTRQGLRAYLRLVLGAALLVLGAGAAQAQSAASEYEIKAAFLLQFADYVEWPALAPSELTPAGLRVCVLGQDPFQSSLDELAGFAKRPVVVQRVRHATEARRCHIVYVRHAQRELEQRDLAVLAEAPVLTVGEGEAFLEDGGIIAFRIEAGRVRLSVRPAAAQRAELRISSRLLGVARVLE